MSLLTPIVDTAYREYADLLLRRHHLLAEGKEDTAEAEAIDDRLTELWETLDEAQRSSLNGMSSDLHWVRRRGVSPPKGRKPEDVTQADREQLAQAETVKDWHAVLHHLRVCAPAMPPNLLAQLRAAAYGEIGLATFAGIFQSLGAAPSPEQTD
jgi:hypothetical protein